MKSDPAVPAEDETTAAVRGIKEGNVLSKQLRQLSAGELKLGAVGPQKRLFVCEVVADVTIEDLQSDAFFAHVGAQLQPWDEIEVRWKDRSRRATVVVHSAGPVWAKVHVIANTVMGSSVAKHVPKGYKVDFDGRGWRVVRESDKAMVRDGFATDREAVAWLQTHLA